LLLLVPGVLVVLAIGLLIAKVERTLSITTAHSDEPANIILNPAVVDERERVLRIQPSVVDVFVGQDNRRVGRSAPEDDAHEFIRGYLLGTSEKVEHAERTHHLDVETCFLTNLPPQRIVRGFHLVFPARNVFPDPAGEVGCG
jgi:hypothetical protein